MSPGGVNVPEMSQGGRPACACASSLFGSCSRMTRSGRPGDEQRFETTGAAPAGLIRTWAYSNPWRVTAAAEGTNILRRVQGSGASSPFTGTEIEAVQSLERSALGL